MKGQDCLELYKDKLEPNSTLILCELNYIVKELNDGQRILKSYYPESKVVQRITFNNDSMNNQNGLFEERWDVGTLVRSGNFLNNIQEGKWLLNTNEFGIFKNGKMMRKAQSKQPQVLRRYCFSLRFSFMELRDSQRSMCM